MEISALPVPHTHRRTHIKCADGGRRQGHLGQAVEREIAGDQSLQPPRLPQQSCPAPSTQRQPPELFGWSLNFNSSE